MTLKERKDCLVQLGNVLSDLSADHIQNAIYRAELENPWFSNMNIHMALNAIKTQFLQAESLDYLIHKYALDDLVVSKRIGLVMAGNIPLVGFHDLLCCFLTGHICLIKYSDKDKALMQFVVQSIITADPRASQYLVEIQRLTDYDAVIATGSNTSAQHFEQYFGHVPHIIRRNRNAVAFLNGSESDEELENLGNDIFTYFGLGCRNVSHISIPDGYDVTRLFKTFDSFQYLKNHNKYKNNYDYNVALLLLNKEPFLQNEMVILKESDQIVSRIGSIHYSHYTDENQFVNWAFTHSSEIQCIVSNQSIPNIQTIGIGSAQTPTIDTYADGIDTIQFLLTV